MIKRILAYLLMLCLLALIAWPAYVGVGWIVSYLAGEGSLLTTWHLEPKRNFLTYFLEGYKASAPIAAVCAIVSVLIIMVMNRIGAAGALLLLVFPAAGYLLAMKYFNASQPSVIALVGTACVLAITTLVLYGFIEKKNGRKSRRSHRGRRRKSTK